MIEGMASRRKGIFVSKYELRGREAGVSFAGGKGRRTNQKKVAPKVVHALVFLVVYI
jgi:hypothetical protein